MEDDIIYLSVNNWKCGIDYPNYGFFKKNYDKSCDGWANLFTEEYCKENKLCVIETLYDMSENLTIAAPRSWVEENCPEFINDPKLQSFIYKPKEGEAYPHVDHLGCKFAEYCEEHIGIEFDFE